ncbi:hypothetical protein [Variovorax paradoxus]|uniref:hypothetical protein n=1 Tax=Variovorax paradoxus TaxID=34073 RepID=UPI003D64D6E5
MAFLALLLSADGALAQSRDIPPEFKTPGPVWRAGSLSPTVSYDRASGMAKAPTGGAQVLHFEKDGPGTVTQETFLQATSPAGQVKSSLTTVRATVTVGSVTDDEGATAKTLTLSPVRGQYRMSDNGVVTTREIAPAELHSSKFRKTYAVVRMTDPNYGRPQEALLLIDLGENKKVDNTDAVIKFFPHSVEK